ncbi:MAG: carbonic anhydrase [uncultured archaeon A07HN63]|nr:MAG: carbonic anhydrase [uncultured archaeon A07HN63]
MDEFVTELLAHNAEHAEQFHTRFDDVQKSQAPHAVTVCCSDSRVLQDAMWTNTQPGRLFSCGNIGNRVVQQTDDGLVVSGDVLYPLVHTDTKTAIVVGHTGCGAVTAAYQALTTGTDEPSGIAHCLDLLTPSLADGVERLPEDLTREAAINRLVEYNVDQQIEHLRASEDVPTDVSIVGVVYDFQDRYSDQRGAVHVINIDGERDSSTLCEQHPEIADRISRLWNY